MTPHFYDTLARRNLAPPRPPGEDPLSFYACGITPYADAHVGHGRSFVVFDLMRKVLETAGYRVNIVRNITDIDDKIIAEAAARGENWHELSHGYAAKNRALMNLLGVTGYEEPHASDHIEDIIALSGRLMDQGHAYANPETGDVLFETSTFQGSDLVRHDSGNLGEYRVDARGKRDASDFVLWKLAKPGEPAWESPWGRGRPGWHVECSAMIDRRFDGRVDYHGGGVDLRFPHHQAEIMQSEAAHGHALAARWVHHGAVRDGMGRKMSKSLGNTVGLEHAIHAAEALRPGWGGAIVRLALLSARWTRPLDWHERILEQAAGHLDRWQQAAAGAEDGQGDREDNEVQSALYDNLNTPLAISRLHALSGLAIDGDTHAATIVKHSLALLGLGNLPTAQPNAHQEQIDQLIQKRDALRADRRWQEADGIRDQLAQLGWVARDKAATRP